MANEGGGGEPMPHVRGLDGVVLVDELDSDEVAQALAGGIPESGGEVRVVEGYKDPLRPEDEVG